MAAPTGDWFTMVPNMMRLATRLVLREVLQSGGALRQEGDRDRVRSQEGQRRRARVASINGPVGWVLQDAGRLLVRSAVGPGAVNRAQEWAAEIDDVDADLLRAARGLVDGGSGPEVRAPLASAGVDPPVEPPRAVAVPEAADLSPDVSGGWGGFVRRNMSGLRAWVGGASQSPWPRSLSSEERERLGRSRIPASRAVRVPARGAVSLAAALMADRSCGITLESRVQADSGAVLPGTSVLFSLDYGFAHLFETCGLHEWFSRHDRGRYVTNPSTRETVPRDTHALVLRD